MARSLTRLFAALLCLQISAFVPLSFADEENSGSSAGGRELTEGRDSEKDKARDPKSGLSTALPAPTPMPAQQGATLYQMNCAGCHGSLATSNKRGRTAAAIQAAIKKNAGGMGFLSTLTTADIQNIAAALR